MATTTTIYVTDEHIEKGVKGSRTSCPIARAFADAGFYNTSVEYSQVYYYESSDEPGDYGRGAVCTEAVRDFQNEFDSGHAVESIELELIRNNDAKNLYKTDELRLA